VGYSDNTNLYAYVANDPVNRTDPTGRECVSRDGTTVCKLNVRGLSPIKFNTPAGWRDFRPGQQGVHRYVHPRTTAGDADRAQRLNEAAANDPTPGHDRPATPAGTLNDATPSALRATVAGAAAPTSPAEALASTIAPEAGALSPVRSYTTTDAQGNVTGGFNVTQPGHPLFPGILQYGTIPNQNGTVTMYYAGEGAGVLQAPGMPTAGPINNVWPGHMRGIDERTP
jgi:hypothetical protein